MSDEVYDRNGVRIVAAFNFWDWAEAFFTLKATDLADDDAEYEDVNAFGAQPGKQEATQDAAL